MSDFQKQIELFQQDYGQIVEQVERVIVGHREVIHQVLTCLFAGGHALLEGVPGVGKTLLVRTLAQTLELSFSRIQFTPDLMPTDITGTNILSTNQQGAREFRFEPGPIFANLILADEINRATPKTQSAILETMQEGTVSVARTTHELPQPLAVLATQNPIDMEGTYPLPEAQLDRFMLKIIVSAPPADEIVAILDRTTGMAAPSPDAVANAARIEQLKSLVRQVPAATHVTGYVARLVAAMHPSATDATPLVKQYLRFGPSPRGAQAVMLAAKVSALRDGRANVAFEDIKQVAHAALRHRLIRNFEGQAKEIAPDKIISEVLQAIPE